MRRLNGKGLPSISPLLLQTIDHPAKDGGVPRRKLAHAILELSRLFTRERAMVTRSYLDDPALASAYVQYFLPVNLSKIQVLLDEMPAVETRERFSVLDLGSGPGSGALAALDWWHCSQSASAGALSVAVVERSQGALRQAERLWHRYCCTSGIKEARLLSIEGDLERPVRGPWLKQVEQGAPYEVILFANCLNELHRDARDPITARTSLVAEMLSLLARHGTMMIIEPALQETSRALHQVRDRLLQAGCCTVYSPCLHERNCPALIHPDDWCHEERAWDPPAVIQQIDEEVGFIKDALKFSYVLLRKDGRTIVPRGSETFRVVSELRVLKGDKRAWLCNEQGRPEIGRLDRARAETNAAWDKCERGTIVRIEGMNRKEGATLARIPDDARVEIIRSV